MAFAFVWVQTAPMGKKGASFAASIQALHGRSHGLLCAVLIAAGCTGDIGINGGGDPPGKGPALSDEGVSPLRALTPYEMQSAIKDVLGDDAVEISNLQPAAVKRGVEALGRVPIFTNDAFHWQLLVLHR